MNSNNSHTGHSDDAPAVRQILAWGGWRQERPAPPDTPWVNTGRRLYVMGDIDGRFRPRSNPYELHHSGAPSPDDPLAGKLQGVWAQPVKALSGYACTVTLNGQPYPLRRATQFTQSFAAVRFDYELAGRAAGIKVSRTDFVAQDRPILFITLTLQNDSQQAVAAQLTFSVYFDLADAWFTSLAGERNDGETVQAAGRHLVARAHSAPDAWAVVVGGRRPPERVQIAESTGQMTYTAVLLPRKTASWTFAVVVESEQGAETALRHLAEWLPQRETLLAEKQALYRSLEADGPRLHTPDAHFDRAFVLARANVQLLEAESPPLGRHFLAGLETFPFWFSNDSAYSLPGLLASNLAETARNQLLIGAQFQENGRIPHQISPAGHKIISGNVQETPQWVTAVWDFYRWTDDRDFLEAVYDTAVSGLFDYALGAADGDGDGYPEGPGMVEREDMGPEKVDAASYLWLALTHLAQMAERLGDMVTATRARVAAINLQVRFDADWWLPEQKLYADSLEADNTPRYTGHWTAVTPLEVGLASPEHGRLALARLRRDYVNEWGLVHTLGADERVWTLPTAALSRGAYRYGNAAMGFALLQNLAQTLDHGSIGLYHELIPEGLSFCQLWSAAAFIRGVVEDLLGVDVCAAQRMLTITPRLPAGWEFVRLEQLTFGEHTITLCATHNDLTVRHESGPAPFFLTCHLPRDAEKTCWLPPDKTITINQEKKLCN